MPMDLIVEDKDSSVAHPVRDLFEAPALQGRVPSRGNNEDTDYDHFPPSDLENVSPSFLSTSQ